MAPTLPRIPAPAHAFARLFRLAGRFRPANRRARTWLSDLNAPGWVVAALVILILAACAPREPADCDQLLGEGRYQTVLSDCESPFFRASAYLGLAGLDLIAALETDDPPGNVVNLLGLKSENLAEKHAYLDLAIEEVRTPETGSEAFALLIGSFLGLGVVTREFLDPNLDGAISDAEMTAATGLSSSGVSTLGIALAPGPPVPAPPLFQVVVGGVPYLVECLDAPPPLCDNNPTGFIKVWDDGNGSGFLASSAPAPSANSADVIAALASATSVNIVGALKELVLPIAIDPAKTGGLEAFLGQGDPATAFPIGMLGYLGLLESSEAALLTFAGGSSGGTEISKHVQAVRGLLDNGGDCIGTKYPGADSPLNFLYALYKTAPGTRALPVPDPENYTGYSVVPNEDLVATGTALPIAATDSVFTVPIGYKLAYPLAPPLVTYDVSLITPRVDQTPDAFSVEFENVPRLAPNAAEPNDGAVTYAEMICTSK